MSSNGAHIVCFFLVLAFSAVGIPSEIDAQVQNLTISIDDSGYIQAAGSYRGGSLTIGSRSVFSGNDSALQPFVLTIDTEGIVKRLFNVGQPRDGSENLISAIAANENGHTFLNIFHSDSTDYDGITLVGPTFYVLSVTESGLDWYSRVIPGLTDLFVTQDKVIASTIGRFDGTILSFNEDGTNRQEETVAPQGAIRAISSVGPSDVVYGGAETRSGSLLGRLDSTFSGIWRIVSSSTDFSWISDVVTDSTGASYFTGLAFGEVRFPNFSESVEGGLFVGRVQSDGAIDWLRSFQEGVSVFNPLVDVLNGVLVVSVPFIAIDGGDETGILIREFSQAGDQLKTTIVPDMTVGVNDYHYFAVDDLYYVLATTRTNLTSVDNCTSVLVSGEVGLFTVDRSCIPTGVEQIDLPGSRGVSIISVYPNPVSSTGSIQLKNELEAASIRIVLTDTEGRTVRELYSGILTTGDHYIPFDVSSNTLASGVYFVRVESASGSFARSVVIQR